MFVMGTDQALWSIDISPLVPDEYGAYRRMVGDALLFFLRSLPAERFARIVAAQEQLPAGASLSQRLAALMCQCPTLHKLGQVVARDRRLSPTLRSRLQALESMEPTTPVSVITRIIRRELPDFQAWGIKLGPAALAEASVAVVIPFATRSTQHDAPDEGVLKVLKPGVEEALAEEIEIWTRLAAFIDERCEHYEIPTLRYAETIETIRDLLSNETKLEQEQAHLMAAVEFYADTDSVRIPALFPFCTPRITAMERIYGRKVTETDQRSEEERRTLAHTVIQALIARPLWAPSTSSIFHADPHAGNLFLTDDARLAILDWSLVGYLGKAARIHTMQVLLGGLTFDAERIAGAIGEMASAPANESALREIADKALGALLPAKLPGFRWLMNLMDDAMLSAGVQFSQDLLLFRKSVLTIEGLIADISTGTCFDHVLPASAAGELYREGFSRLFASPISRDFGTHLSNLDLLSLYWGAPATAVRYWKGFWDQWGSGGPH
jgi:ubiquinone biosynthesis protein